VFSAPTACVSGHACDCRVAHDDVGVLLQLLLLHGWKRQVPGAPQNGPAHAASILLREETLWHDNIEVNAKGKSFAAVDKEHEGLVSQDPAQPAGVGVQTPAGILVHWLCKASRVSSRAPI